MASLYRPIWRTARTTLSLRELRAQAEPGHEETEIIALRMTQDELAECERSAKQADLKLSDWMRDRLGKAAKRESKRD